MASVTTFDSTKEALSDILRDIREGKLQLPDFQRGWVWADDGIKSLLASVSQSFPIGAVMMLQSGGEVRFQPRLIEGVTTTGPRPNPDRLLLDGQQRLTSLFQALCLDRPVETLDAKGKKIRRWYYIDMAKAINPGIDREEAMLSLPEDRVLRSNFGRTIDHDYSTREAEYEAGIFPLRYALDPNDWEEGFREYFDHDREKSRFFQTFENAIINAFRHYQLPIISLRKETPKQAVCLVFERVNSGGVKLTAFELLTATFAAENFNLREDWFGDAKKGVVGRERTLKVGDGLGVLENIDNTQFLQGVALLHTLERRRIAEEQKTAEPPAVLCTRQAILDLPVAAYQKWKDPLVEGFKKAARFLSMQKIFAARDLPYQTQLVPLAACLTLLGNEWEKDAVRRRLARWFWCGVFGEKYGSAIESRFAKDILEVPRWAAAGDGPEPSTVQESSFSPDRLYSLRIRLSAAYKGVHALLMRDGGLDLRTGEPIEHNVFWQEQIDIHHIFPKAWCIKNGVPREDYDSIVNKTAISRRTNIIIGGNAPSTYLARVEREAGIASDRMDTILASHAIDPATLRKDDFQKFFQARFEALLQRIEAATGKSIPRDVAEDEDAEYDLGEEAAE